ncbi:uncharacterized oxidoreductase ZK1290.5 [Parasteatoda tepidariorum]|uniref:uncharacterized oxidoreductase ZK1290.5 n=1 Tax=Parasteatoda tepidariorum TaxID=114398 RepID=UPI00077FE3CF|nr:uncharacterized oxidoreductase ZK1290.5 [Parasteatoda tepidariorum]XP_015919348.1 uncharacterized oxidoreductase ZK1290.5 [Parasteatoda tepidariorum]
MPVTTSKGDFGPREVELSNGVKIPTLGLGTSHSGGYSQEAVVYALKVCNYRLIDTAKRYGCEEFLQAAIHLSGVPREDIFLTTKLWCTDYGASTTRKAFYGSLKRLGVDYLDLYMMHWPLCVSSCPNKKQTLEETWRELELLYDEGLSRCIGVSNYGIEDLESLLDTASIAPQVNQVEFNPFQNPSELKEFCVENKIQVEGYCPLGKGKLLGEKAVLQVARRCGRTPAQILIRWSIQNEVIAIPKSTQIERVKENCKIFDFHLQENEMSILNDLHDGRRSVDICNIQKSIDSLLPDGYKLTLKK